MPVTSITYQPTTGQLLAAYRPIVIKVQATATGGGPLPPYVVCDIYIENVYYKSTIRTSPESTTDTYSVYQFDISDALQEYLQADLAALDNNNLLQAPHMSAKVYCRFRSSDIVDGFTVEEPTKPVQATRLTAAVAGTGFLSNTFFVVNAALQHEDNQNLASHLNYYKQGTWAENAYPLTHRNRYFFCDDDSDHFPFLFTGDCITADIKLNYRLKGTTEFLQATAQDINTCDTTEFEVNVTGNRVDVSLADPLPAGQSVLVQYKKQADADWIAAGWFTTQDFFFNVNGDDIAGDYDIRIIHFCTPCLLSDPVLHTFTLDGSEENLAWRGTDPFCVQQTFGSPIYIKLELRNPTTEVVDIPDSTFPFQKTTTQKADLYCLFYSDVTRLTPLVVTQNPIKIFVKTVSDITETSGASYNRIIESVNTYSVAASGVEVLLGSVNTNINILHYSSFPTVSSSSDTDNTFDPYPDFQLVGGNTGDRGYANLQEYNTDTNIPTGETKENAEADPDYIPPAEDETLCPSGPDVTSVSYGYGLNVSKVQMNYSTIFNLYATPVADTNAGGWSFVKPLPKNVNTIVSVKAKTLDSGNHTGFVKCRISYYDSGGTPQVYTHNCPNDIETTVPATFQNIYNINISNT